MNKRQATIEALSMIWGMATWLCDKGNGDLSDRLSEDVMDGRCTEEEAIMIQEQIEYESNLIWNKMHRIKNRNG